MIDPSHHRRPDPSGGLLAVVATGVALVAAVPAALWALANPAYAVAAGLLLGAGVASYRLLGRVATGRPESPVRSSGSASDRAARTDGSREVDA